MDGLEIGAASMYRMATPAQVGVVGVGAKMVLTEVAFAGAVLFMAGHRDATAMAGHHAMLHETMHTCGPVIDRSTPGAVAVEELITELATREVLRLDLSVSYEDAPRIAGSVSKSGCYQDLIDMVATCGSLSALASLASSALEIKRSMQGHRGAYQVLGTLLSLAGCADVAGCSDQIMAGFSSHWTESRAAA